MKLTQPLEPTPQPDHSDVPTIAELRVACADLWQAMKQCQRDITDAKENFEATLQLLGELQDSHARVHARVQYIFRAFDQRAHEEKEG